MVTGTSYPECNPSTYCPNNGQRVIPHSYRRCQGASTQPNIRRSRGFEVKFKEPPRDRVSQFIRYDNINSRAKPDVGCRDPGVWKSRGNNTERRITGDSATRMVRDSTFLHTAGRGQHRYSPCVARGIAKRYRPLIDRDEYQVPTPKTV